MSDLLAANDNAQQANTPLSAGSERPGAQGGETTHQSTEPLESRTSPPLKWFGAVLLVIGIILISAALYINQNTTAEAPLAVSGSLGPVSALPATAELGPNAIIGEVTVPETVAVFENPQGKSIARINAGTYGLLSSQPGWAQVVLVGPNQNGLFSTGWISVHEGVTVKTG